MSVTSSPEQQQWSRAELSEPWWKTAVIYQIYPRSFQDSNGDGVGDIPGITSRLDYLQWLGVDAIWLSPINVSPNKDWGYDVADYCAVDPELGTLQDVDTLIAEADARGIKVVLDLVPNHTSDQHAWFKDAISSKDAKHRDWYVWADPAEDGGPPNNWISHFGGPAWTLDAASGQYYCHNFLKEQPDLNWWNPEVGEAFDDILRFWYDRGIAGFRIDVCHGIYNDRQLRDNEGDPPDDPNVAWDQIRNMSLNQPEVHDLLREWRTLSDRYTQQPVLLGETWTENLADLAAFYGSDDELHLAFNFHFTMSHLDARQLAAQVRETLKAYPDDAWPAWALSNHDISRCATRWADGDPERALLGLAIMLMLPGTPVLYQGDEIAMTDVEVPWEQAKDPLDVFRLPGKEGRDAVRTPMQWTSAKDLGFSDAEPWLPAGDASDANVEDQRADDRSHLNRLRNLLALRRHVGVLQTGRYEEVLVTDSVWTWKRDNAVVVANIGPTPVAFADAGIEQDWELRWILNVADKVDGVSEVGPWQLAVFES
jgi:alpha-glucosidase